jgi:hypothetical protein
MASAEGLPISSVQLHVLGMYAMAAFLIALAGTALVWVTAALVGASTKEPPTVVKRFLGCALCGTLFALACIMAAWAVEGLETGSVLQIPRGVTYVSESTPHVFWATVLTWLSLVMSLLYWSVRIMWLSVSHDFSEMGSQHRGTDTVKLVAGVVYSRSTSLRSASAALDRGEKRCGNREATVNKVICVSSVILPIPFVGRRIGRDAVGITSQIGVTVRANLPKASALFRT